jgi:hypothetical protein
MSTFTLATPAVADTSCTTNTDQCMVDFTTQTPLGPVDITVSPTNVVTVHLSPYSSETRVRGVAFALPPGPPVMPGYTRTTVATSAGTVNIDTVEIPPGPPVWPSWAIISIHPPSPCRATTTGTTVVFTPRPS